MKLFSIKSRFPRAHVCNALFTAAALVRTSLSLSGQHIFAVQISWSWNAIFLRRRRFCAHAQEAEPHRRRGPRGQVTWVCRTIPVTKWPKSRTNFLLQFLPLYLLLFLLLLLLLLSLLPLLLQELVSPLKVSKTSHCTALSSQSRRERTTPIVLPP